jgi:hypothetical protein
MKAGDADRRIIRDKSVLDITERTSGRVEGGKRSCARDKVAPTSE